MKKGQWEQDIQYPSLDIVIFIFYLFFLREKANGNKIFNIPFSKL